MHIIICTHQSKLCFSSRLTTREGRAQCMELERTVVDLEVRVMKEKEVVAARDEVRKIYFCIHR